MNELTALRTETGKIYDGPVDAKSGTPSYTQEARTGPIHYKEEYKDTDPWLDLDESYCEPGELKGIGKVLVYPRLPNIVTVFQDRCGYQIQSRSNPDHVARVELVSIYGQNATAWQDSAALKTSVRVHPYRVGIWKDFSAASKAKATTMRWKVTELGNAAKDSHPFFFRETPEAYNTADLTSLDSEATKQAKVAIEAARTRIDDTSWYWDELIPKEAKLVDTDFQVPSAADDGEYLSTGTGFSATGLTHHWLGYSKYNAFHRFTNVTIQQASTINSAYMQHRAWGNNNGSVTLRITAAASDNPNAPTSAEGARTTSRTSANTSYNPVTWSSSSWYSTPSILTIVQELVNRPGFTSGNAMLFFIEYQSGGNIRDWYAYDYNSSSAPKLTATWTEPTRRGPHIYVPNVSWLSKSLLKRREI